MEPFNENIIRDALVGLRGQFSVLRHKILFIRVPQEGAARMLESFYFIRTLISVCLNAGV